MPIRCLSDADGNGHVAAQICVIGAGFAGLLVSQRLAKKGVKVVLLESGSATTSRLDTNRLNEIIDTSGRYTGATLGRFRTLGGSSTRWSGGLKPVSPAEMGNRPHLGLAGWPFPPSDLDKYSIEIEELFGVESSSYDEDLNEVVDPDRVFLRSDPDFACKWIKFSPRKKLNVAKLMGPDLERLSNLEIWTGATVYAFQLNRNSERVAQIEARDLGGRAIKVTADEFVLACGTIESTRLLLLLDRTADNQAFKGCNALGRYFQDHLCATIGKLDVTDRVAAGRMVRQRFSGPTRRQLHLDLTEKAQQLDRVASARVELRPVASQRSSIRLLKALTRDWPHPGNRPSLQQAWSVASDSAFLALFGWTHYVRKRPLLIAEAGVDVNVCAEQVPNANSRITLSNERDLLGTYKVKLDWQFVDRDESTFRSVVARLSAYWRRAGFDRSCPIVWSRAALDPAKSMLGDVVDAYHPSGSTRMGTDPRESVVDANLRCHHVPNVYVASASTFPAAGNANPTFTIMKLALRLTDVLLKHQLGSRSQCDFPVDTLARQISQPISRSPSPANFKPQRVGTRRLRR